MRVRHLVGLTALVLIAGLTVPTQAASAGTDCEPLTAALIAGQHTPIGTVTVSCSSNALHVTYDVTEAGWCLLRTHTYAGTDRPKKSAPGSFPFHSGDLDCATSHTETIFFDEVDFERGAALFIATHADVRSNDCGNYGSPVEALSNFCASLPEEVTMTIGTWQDSYLRVEITNGGVLNGIYGGWCVDTDHSIDGLTYQGVHPICYGDSDFLDLFDYPENVDLVAWILNQELVGTPAPIGLYTYGDVQRAIWSLIEDEQSDANLGEWHQANVDEIVSEALLNGNGYVPGCGDLVPVALHLANEFGETTHQVVLIGVPLECEPKCGTETAWAFSLGTENYRWWKKKKATGWGVFFPFSCCD